MIWPFRSTASCHCFRMASFTACSASWRFWRVRSAALARNVVTSPPLANQEGSLVHEVYQDQRPRVSQIDEPQAANVHGGTRKRRRRGSGSGDDGEQAPLWRGGGEQ